MHAPTPLGNYEQLIRERATKEIGGDVEAMKDACAFVEAFLNSVRANVANPANQEIHVRRIPGLLCEFKGIASYFAGQIAETCVFNYWHRYYANNAAKLAAQTALGKDTENYKRECNRLDSIMIEKMHSEWQELVKDTEEAEKSADDDIRRRVKSICG